jgi:hypothetical protein
VTVTCTVRNDSPLRYLSVEAWVDLTEDPLPPQPVYLDGDPYWEGSLDPGEFATVSALVAFATEGTSAGHCRARILQEGAQVAVDWGLGTEPFAVREDHGYFNPPYQSGLYYHAPTDAYPAGLDAIVENSPLIAKPIGAPQLLVITSKAELDQAIAEGYFPAQGKFEWRKAFDMDFDVGYLFAFYDATRPTTGYGLTTSGSWVKGNTIFVEVQRLKPPATMVGSAKPATPHVVLWNNKLNVPPGALRFVVSQGCVKIDGQVTFVKPPDCVEILSTVRDVGGLGPPAGLEERWQKGLEEEKAP